MRERSRSVVQREREHEPDRATIDVDNTLETHTDTENGDLASKVPNGITGDA